jgi:hypothetical protein
MHAPHSFVAYVDESGDEGFSFSLVPGRGSSRWFVLSAALVRVQEDGDTVTLMRDLRSAFGLPTCRQVHFRKLTHSRKMEWGKRIGSSHVRTVSIAIQKQELSAPEKFRDGNRLYHFAVRLLLERVSWCCRDAKYDQGDGTVRVIFSNRGSLSYEDIRRYASLLQGQAAQGADIRVHWPAVSINAMCARPHDQLAGLQVADAVAAATFAGLTEDEFGYREERYMQEMWPRVYRHRGQFAGYGLKVFPNQAVVTGLLPWAK